MFRILAKYRQDKTLLISPDQERGFHSRLTLLILVFIGLVLTGCDAAVPQTRLDTAQEKASQCVEPTEDMRKYHMVYLDAHRDEVMLKGIRTTQYSLNECVNCHVPRTKENGEALHYPDDEHFCATCHQYAGVKIDCFQCHADRPQVMEKPDYQHQLSANTYHNALSDMTAPNLQEILTVSRAQQGVGP